MIMKKDQIDPRKNPIGYYLIQLQSDKIATVCVLHLMKHLFQSFILDSRKQAEMNVDLEETEVDITSKDVKITAISLFDELGNLFQKELKQLYFNKNNKKVTFPVMLYLDDYMIHKVQKENLEEIKKYESVDNQNYKPRYKYELYGIVCHSGGMGGGHYVAYTKQKY